jgi:predicted DNA-binding WGR domain protein
VVNNKQYTIEIVVEGHQYKVMPNWGAIGRKPTGLKEEKLQKLDKYASLAAATGILEKTLVEKKKKGYVVVRDSGGDTAVSVGAMRSPW